MRSTSTGNDTVMLLTPAEDVFEAMYFMDSTPLISFSITRVTVSVVVRASAPMLVADTLIWVGAICGSFSSGSSGIATAPRIRITSEHTVVSTGLRMNRSDRLIAFCSRHGRLGRRAMDEG